MTIIYILLILLQAGILIYFIRRGKKKVGNIVPHDADSYLGMRSLAISIKPAQLKLTIPDTEILVYGVIMDCNIGGTIGTLAAYITGAASLYLSTGDSRTGGGKNPATGEAAAEFVVAAQAYINRTIPVAVTNLPIPGCVRFYLLTNHNIYAAQEPMVFIEDGSSPWISLFEKGNQVINEMQHNENGIVTG